MKRILTSLIFALIAAASPVRAETVNDLVGLGMNPALAEYVAANVAGGVTLSNAEWFKGSNQAGSADINLIRVDSGDNTVVNSSASDLLILQLADDAQRIISFASAADTLLTTTFGDGGTTAAQNWDITAGTGAGDDDQRICIGGGGGACAADKLRGAYAYVEGEEDAGGGDAAVAGLEDLILSAVDDVTVTADDDVVIATEGAGDIVTIAAGGATVTHSFSGTALTLAASVGIAGADDLALTASTDDVIVTATDDVVIQTQGAGDIVTIAAAGTTPSVTVASTGVTVAAGIPLVGGAGSWGWRVVDASDNAACSTGCGISACLFGWDTGTATLAGILQCDNTTADLCFCTGAAS